MTPYVGVIITLGATLFYSLRYSFVKDLGQYNLSKAQTNLYYRLVSLIPIVLFVILLGENILSVHSTFPIWFAVALTVSVVFSLFQIFILQKHDFSLFGSLKAFSILFSTLGGILLLREVYSIRQCIGLVVIGFSLLILLAPQRTQVSKMVSSAGWILLYYLIEAGVYISNKKAVALSSPPTFTLYMTIGLIIVNFALAIIFREKPYTGKNPKTNILLVLVGIFSAFSFIGISYGYKLLPVGIVVAIASLESFISILIAKKKYRETNLLPKIIASVVAFGGVLLIVL